MKHLNRAELVDFIEASPLLPAGRARHVSACHQCRAEADALRSMRALATTDEVPEPSPLFWDHFSARVAEAVREEEPGRDRAAVATMRWRRSPLATWAAAATMAVLVMVTVVWRTTLHAPAPARGPAMSGASARTPTIAPDAAAAGDDSDVDADEAWAVVRAAAQDLRWEEAHAAGLSAHPGAAEGLALELTADERSELARLLDKELKHTGV
jgi:hypothetical protein